MIFTNLEKYVYGFLKTGLAKKTTTHSTTCQFETKKKSFKGRLKAFIWRQAVSYGQLVVRSGISLSPNLKWRKFWNIYSVICLREVSNRFHFSLEFFRLSEMQSKSAWLRLT